MKKTSIIKMAIVAGLFGCFGGAIAQETMRIGMTPEPYMPFTRVTAAGEWEGIEADLTRALCERMPVECSFEQMAWEGLMPSLLAGKIDAAIGAFTVTPERMGSVSFSIPYYTESTALVGQKSDNREIAVRSNDDGAGDSVFDATSLDGAIIGVQVASTQYNYTQRYLSNLEIKTYDTADNAMADLIAGRVDYVLAAEMFIEEFLAQQPNDDLEIKAVAPKNTVLGSGIAYAVGLNDEATLNKVNTALRELEEDGTLQKIVDKWAD